MTDVADVPRRRAWLMAARPHTLPAAVSPVLVGSGLAVHDGVFAPAVAFAALVGAALIQIGTNLANDYYDARKGADTDEREGFTRVTQAGLIEPRRVWEATYGTFGLAILVGGYLVWIGGLPIVVVGLTSVAAGLLYTGGPYPYGYRGLGDLFVFVFFGVVAVTGTYYVQAVSAVSGTPLWVPPGTVTADVLVASLPLAALITNILVVNNIRDVETDRAAGKRTLAVYLGYRGSRVEFVALAVLAYLVPVWFVGAGYGPWVLLPFLTLPLAVSLTRTVLTETSGEALNPALTRAGQLAAAFALTFAAGLVV